MRNRINEINSANEINWEKVILYCILGVLAAGILIHGINQLIEIRMAENAIKEMGNQGKQFNEAMINTSQQLIKTMPVMPQQNYQNNKQPANTIKYKGYIEKNGIRTYY
jgi:non-homologous end joining protein Ku